MADREPMARRRTLRERIGERIARQRDDVFLTREFRDLGGEDQARLEARLLTERHDAEIARAAALAAVDR